MTNHQLSEVDKSLSLKNIALKFQEISPEINAPINNRFKTVNQKVQISKMGSFNNSKNNFSPYAQEFIPKNMNPIQFPYYAYDSNAQPYSYNQQPFDSNYNTPYYSNDFPCLSPTVKNRSNSKQKTPIIQYYKPKKICDSEKNKKNCIKSEFINTNCQPCIIKDNLNNSLQNDKPQIISNNKHNTVMTLNQALDLTRKYINNRIPVLIFMRGCPGSGKSSMARELKHDGIVLSSDNFLVVDGEYKYSSERIRSAHENNRLEAMHSIASKISPIIIDNTNTQVWEMIPYAKMAMDNNYKIEIIEPCNEWRLKPKKLAKLNIHGVDLKKIRMMMDRYEHNITPDILTAAVLKDKLENKNNLSNEFDKTKKSKKNGNLVTNAIDNSFTADTIDQVPTTCYDKKNDFDHPAQNSLEPSNHSDLSINNSLENQTNDLKFNTNISRFKDSEQKQTNEEVKVETIGESITDLVAIDNAFINLNINLNKSDQLLNQERGLNSSGHSPNNYESDIIENKSIDGTEKKHSDNNLPVDFLDLKVLSHNGFSNKSNKIKQSALVDKSLEDRLGSTVINKDSLISTEDKTMDTLDEQYKVKDVMKNNVINDNEPDIKITNLDLSDRNDLEKESVSLCNNKKLSHYF